MDINNIQRKYNKTGPKVNINIKVSEDVSKWLREKNYSPTGIFSEALKLLECPHIQGSQEPDYTKEESKPDPAEETYPQS